MTLADLRALTWGKTHFFDAGTLRFFRSRISRIRRMANGNVRGVESAGWQGPRQFRAWEYLSDVGTVRYTAWCWSANRAETSFGTWV